jgi:hypothetical protein
VRFRELERVVLARERAAVITSWGPVTGMVATHQGRRRFSPEYESCREAAQRGAVPLREVYLAAQQAWRAGEEGRP